MIYKLFYILQDLNANFNIRFLNITFPTREIWLIWINLVYLEWDIKIKIYSSMISQVICFINKIEIFAL